MWEDMLGVWGGVGSVLGCGECGKVWGGVGVGSRCVEVCLGDGEMCLVCGERCGKGVGEGAKGVWLGLMLGKGRWGCGEVLGEMWDNPGERGSVGKRVVSRSGTPTLLTPTPPTSNP